jgi:hypothetical protein
MDQSAMEQKALRVLEGIGHVLANGPMRLGDVIDRVMARTKVFPLDVTQGVAQAPLTRFFDRRGRVWLAWASDTAVRVTK